MGPKKDPWGTPAVIGSTSSGFELSVAGEIWFKPNKGCIWDSQKKLSPLTQLDANSGWTVTATTEKGLKSNQSLHVTSHNCSILEQSEEETQIWKLNRKSGYREQAIYLFKDM